MPLGSKMLPARKGCMMASHCHLVITAGKQGIGILTAHHLIEAFLRLEEIHTERWEEEVDVLVLLTWKMRMTKDLLWETKREYVEEWQRNTLIATTSSYHNLVIRWNMGTLPQGATNLPRAMEHTMYYLMDDEQTDLSIIVLGSEWSSKN